MLAPMRRHAGAVILLGGWLLMQPSVYKKKDGSSYADTNAPLSKWEQAAFDTAAECEKARTENSINALRPSSDDRARTALYLSALAARCVPADSVYPAATTKRP